MLAAISYYLFISQINNIISGIPEMKSAKKVIWPILLLLVILFVWVGFSSMSMWLAIASTIPDVISIASIIGFFVSGIVILFIHHNFFISECEAEAKRKNKESEMMEKFDVVDEEKYAT